MRDDRGVSALELAFIAPSLILLIFFVVQVALFLYGRSVALQSAREGVTQLRLASNSSQYDKIKAPVAVDVESFADGVGRGVLIRSKPPTSSYDEKDGQVTMTVTGRSISLVPFLHLNISEHASGAIERFQQTPVTAQDSGQ